MQSVPRAMQYLVCAEQHAVTKQSRKADVLPNRPKQEPALDQDSGESATISATTS